MAKPRRTLPARRKKTKDDSLLIRSAESVGRVIGSLQRQLDAARQLTVRMSVAETRASGSKKTRPRAAQSTKSTAKKARARKRPA